MKRKKYYFVLQTEEFGTLTFEPVVAHDESTAKSIACNQFRGVFRDRMRSLELDHTEEYIKPYKESTQAPEAMCEDEMNRRTSTNYFNC